MTTTDFSTWSRENLERFANASYQEILHLQADLKAALEAYRDLNKRRKDDQIEQSHLDTRRN
jgi:cation transport regulator ChaB